MVGEIVAFGRSAKAEKLTSCTSCTELTFLHELMSGTRLKALQVDPEEPQGRDFVEFWCALMIQPLQNCCHSFVGCCFCIPAWIPKHKVPTMCASIVISATSPPKGRRASDEKRTGLGCVFQRKHITTSRQGFEAHLTAWA